MEIKAKQIVVEEIEKITPDPKNENEHPEEQIKVLEKVIRVNGFREPLVISNRSGFVVCGHGRLQAALNLGMTKVPVVYQDFANEAEETRHRLASNEVARHAKLDEDLMIKNLESLDFDLKEFDFEEIGLIDFNLPEVEVIGEVEEDSVPEVKHDPVTRKGDIWLLGNHRVMCGDSTMINDVEKLMKGERADMLYTDPPYGIKIVKNNRVGGDNAFGKGAEKIGKNKIKTTIHKEVLGDESIDAAVAIINNKHLLDCKTEIIWGGNYYANHLDNSNCWIVWDKKTGDSTFADAELAWTNQKSKVRIFEHRWSGLVKDSEIGQSRVHPTQKPIALAEWCFEIYNEPKSVIDLFLGSGSTLIACEKTSRKCYGMELNEHYCDVICKRWSDFTGKDPILESNGKTYKELLNEKTI